MIRFTRTEHRPGRLPRERPLRGDLLLDVVTGARRTDDPAARALAEWLLDQASNHTRDAYALDLEHWTAWLAERGTAVTEATHSDATAWRNDLGRSRAKPATVNRRLSAMSSLYVHLVRSGLVAANPFASVKRHDVGPSERVLSETDARAVVRAAVGSGHRDALLINLLLVCGLRVSEAVDADADDVTATGHHTVLRVTRKGSRPQNVPLPLMTRYHLDRWLTERAEALSAAGAEPSTAEIVRLARKRASDEAAGRPDRTADARRALLLNSRGERMSRRTAFETVARLAAGAGVGSETAPVTPHVLRATFATLAAADGIPVPLIQNAMGHASITTTQGYVRINETLDNNPSHHLAQTLHPGDLLDVADGAPGAETAQ